ncbi:MAG TPA: hypothetical protein VHE81_01355 [Lacipirellulaceae bacterium]|nr:hypothetical protein [Lacipirellulaceae bacterium]
MQRFDPEHPKGGGSTYPNIPHLAKSAVFGHDGCETTKAAAANYFSSAHPTAGAEIAAAIAAKRIAELEPEERQLRRRKNRTLPTREIITCERVAKPSWVHLGVPVVLLAFALFGLYLSNFVVATYAVRSGADLYATDPAGARLFAATTFLAAVGIKVFEHWLPNDLLRGWYRGTFFAAGMVAFAFWSACAAVAFAPDTSATGLWILNAANGDTTTKILVLAHVVSDVAWGYIISSSAWELAVAPYRRIDVPNPRYESLAAQHAAVRAEIQACQDRLTAAQDYLASVKDGRAAVEAHADLEFHRAQETWSCVEAAAIAEARLRYLHS